MNAENIELILNQHLLFKFNSFQFIYQHRVAVASKEK